MQVTRDNIKLNERIEAATDVEAEGGEEHIVQKLQIFKALREQSEADQAASNARASSVAKSGRNTKRGKADVNTDIDRDSIAADSPGGPSPKVAMSSGAASRLLKTGGGSRSGSVPAAREPSVKVEDSEVDVKGRTRHPQPLFSSGLSLPPSSFAF